MMEFFLGFLCGVVLISCLIWLLDVFTTNDCPLCANYGHVTESITPTSYTDQRFMPEHSASAQEAASKFKKIADSITEMERTRLEMYNRLSQEKTE